jgi:peptidoglycan/xylan/chitin deacetylase (PgdA/CDA1 family)
MLPHEKIAWDRIAAMAESKDAAAPPSREAPARHAPLVRWSAAVHAAGVAAVVAAPRAWPWALGAILADHALLTWGSLWPRSLLVGPNLRRLPESAARAGKVALTFDDGPDPAITPAVLRRLAERRVRATFFCIGERAERHPDLVREIARQGHDVENHSFRHPYRFCFYAPAALGADIDRAQATLASLAGRAPRFFRAPAGLRNPWTEPVLASRGLRLVSWTRRGLDTVSRRPQTVLDRLTRGLLAGDILVLHDGDHAPARGSPPVLEVLPRLLDRLEAAGLESTTLARGVAHAS